MSHLSITSLGLAAVLATTALAPCRAETFDPGFLDRMAEERNAAKVPGKPEPSPPKRHQVLIQPRRLLVCMNVTQWSPILAAPRPDAPVIGRTLDVAAATTTTTAGYAEIVPSTSNSVGYVAKALLTPYRSTLNPGAPCTVAFTTAGRIVFHR